MNTAQVEQKMYSCGTGLEGLSCVVDTRVVYPAPAFTTGPNVPTADGPA
jgi:hypothetical protein